MQNVSALFGKSNLDSYFTGLQITACNWNRKLSHGSDPFSLRHSSACDLLLRMADEERFAEGKALNDGKLRNFEHSHSHHNSPIGYCPATERKSGPVDSIPREVENSDVVANHRPLLGICERSRIFKKSLRRPRRRIRLRSDIRKAERNLRLSYSRYSEVEYQVSVSKRAKDPLHVLLKDLKLTDDKADEPGLGTPKMNSQADKKNVPTGLVS